MLRTEAVSQGYIALVWMTFTHTTELGARCERLAGCLPKRGHPHRARQQGRGDRVRNALRRDRHLRDYCGSERIRRRRSSASAVPSSPPIGAPYIRAGQYVPWSATYRFRTRDAAQDPGAWNQSFRQPSIAALLDHPMMCGFPPLCRANVLPRS
jgi:hypothetical protein